MNQTHFAIWLETGTGQRSLIASSSCQTFALLVGEALWAYFGQIRATSLDVRVIEVQDLSSPDSPESPRIIARWSGFGREQLEALRRSCRAHEREQHTTSHAGTLSDASSHPVPEQQAEHVESAGLAAFFPAAQEWAVWRSTWKEWEI